MNTAKQINQKLDDILAIRAEIKRMDTDLKGDEPLKNIQTGESVNKEEALKVVEEMIDRIKFELNEITNNGKNVKNIFTNNYYINDMMQDREISHGIKNGKKF